MFKPKITMSSIDISELTPNPTIKFQVLLAPELSPPKAFLFVHVIEHYNPKFARANNKSSFFKL